MQCESDFISYSVYGHVLNTCLSSRAGVFIVALGFFSSYHTVVFLRVALSDVMEALQTVRFVHRHRKNLHLNSSIFTRNSYYRSYICFT